MKKIVLSVIIAITSVVNVQAQKQQDSLKTAYSLADIQEFAIKNNSEAKNASIETKIAKAKKWETIAIGLPQVSASAEYQNFPDIPTQLMPNFIAPAVYGVNMEGFGLMPIKPLQEGDKMPVQFGSEHNANWGVSVSQLIFSGEYIVGLRASKIYLELSKKSLEKKEIEVKETVTKTYYLILVTEESIKVIDSVYNSLSELYKETKKIQEAGLLEETDVEQLKLNLKNTESSIVSFKSQRDVLYRLLKFQAGFDFDKEIKLSGKLNSITEQLDNKSLLSEEFEINKNIDFQLMQVQENLTELNLQREKSTFLPTLAAYFSYSKKAMSDEFDFFDKSAEWYPTSVVGVKLDIPIFSSGKRLAKVRQKRFELDKVRNTKYNAEQGLRLKVIQTRSDYETAWLKLYNQKQSKQLAKKIYENNLIKYKAGTESSLALTQSQNQYFMSLSEYYRVLGDLIDKRIKLLTLMNKL